MIVAAHQPLHLPWLGFFQKVAACDVFVIMDDLQFTQRDFQNRNRVKANNGPTWLTVPLVHGHRDDLICGKRIANGCPSRHSWQTRTWRTLTTHYGPSEYFGRYAPDLQSVYTRRWDKLLDLNLHLLSLMLGWLEIPTKMVLSASLGLHGRLTDRIVDLCLRLGASTYLSGSGGAVEYLEEGKFLAAGIDVIWQEFNHPTYEKRYPSIGFLPNLSGLED
ncbi:MAG: WbqC family protein [Gemmatimonadota bacterium]